jgi:hypothetical protein
MGDLTAKSLFRKVSVPVCLLTAMRVDFLMIFNEQRRSKG